MNVVLIVAAVLVLGMAVMFVEMARLPAGITREHRVEQRRIFSKTSAVVHASPEDALHLLQTRWSWWKRARAGKMTDAGDGRTQFLFHPVCFFGLLGGPPAFVVRFDRTENLAGGGARIHATLTGDFDGRAEYTVRPGTGGTTVELAWCGAEVRSVLRFAPIAMVAAVHCWRERLGVQGLRDRLESGTGRAAAVSS